MPFAGYKNFDACVKANQDKENPEAYCGSIKARVEDKMKVQKQGPPKPDRRSKMLKRRQIQKSMVEVMRATKSLVEK